MYREFWQLVIKDYGRLRLAGSLCIVTVVVSILEGLNIGLLIPLLESFQSQEQTMSAYIADDRVLVLNPTQTLVHECADRRDVFAEIFLFNDIQHSTAGCRLNRA